MDRVTRGMKFSVRLVLSRIRKRGDAKSAEGMRVPMDRLAARWGIGVATLGRALRVLRATGAITVDNSTRPPVIRYVRSDVRSTGSDALAQR